MLMLPGKQLQLPHWQRSRPRSSAWHSWRGICWAMVYTTLAMLPWVSIMVLFLILAETVITPLQPAGQASNDSEYWHPCSAGQCCLGSATLATAVGSAISEQSIAGSCVPLL